MAEQTQEELNNIQAMIKEAFDMFDKDGSGEISAVEMREVLAEKLGIEISEEKSKDIVAELDKDGSGQIDYEEFKAFVNDLLQQQARAAMIARLNEVFRSYDIDGDGFITREEIKQGVKEIDGSIITDEEAAEIIKSIGDVDNDGKINFQEFSEKYL